MSRVLRVRRAAPSAARPGEDSSGGRRSHSRTDRLTPAVVRAEVDHGRAELVADADRPLGLDAADRRHRAEPRRPRRPDAPGVRVPAADRATCSTRSTRRRPPRCASCTSAAARGRCPATSPPPARARPSGSWSSTAALVELVRAPAARRRDRARRAGRRRPRRARRHAPPARTTPCVLDVFAGARIPAHLTSVEFVQLVARALRAGRGLRREPRRRSGWDTRRRPRRRGRSGRARLRPRPGRDRRRGVRRGRRRRGAGRAARPPVRQPRAGRRERPGTDRRAAGRARPAGWRPTRSPRGSSPARPSPGRRPWSPTRRPRPPPPAARASSASEALEGAVLAHGLRDVARCAAPASRRSRTSRRCGSARSTATGRPPARAPPRWRPSRRGDRGGRQARDRVAVVRPGLGAVAGVRAQRLQVERVVHRGVQLSRCPAPSRL